MRFGLAVPARPTPGDRSPLIKALTANAPAVAPHASTQRLTYTVPASRKCLITHAAAEILRNTAAAPVGIYGVAQNIAPLAGGFAGIVLINALTNAVGDRYTERSNPQHIMLAGDIFNANDSDLGTGGTVTYTHNFMGVEHDA